MNLNERETFFTDNPTDIHTDNVNHPSHYKAYSLENLETIKGSMSSQEYFGFLKGNTLKYLYRYQLKNKAVEDLEKAEFYLKRINKVEII